MKTSFRTRVSRMGHVDMNIYVIKYYFFVFFLFFNFFESLKSKSTEMLRPQKSFGKSTEESTLHVTQILSAHFEIKAS